MARASFLATIALIGLFACRQRDEFDETQRVAYSVKPAVVRISAYATAEFHYPGSALREAIRAAGGALTGSRADGIPVRGSVETGAGGSGSGFIVHPDGLVVTSGHVVAPTRDRNALEKELLRNGAIAALVLHLPVEVLRSFHRDGELEGHVTRLASQGRLAAVNVVNTVELSNGEAHPFRVRSFSPDLRQGGADLALLKIARKDLPTLTLADSSSVRVGEQIWSVGYPAVASSTDAVIGGWLSRESDLEATFNPGSITAIRRNSANEVVFQSNVAIYKGNSGGPAVNTEAQAIGVSTWGHSDVEQIKFLVPAATVRGFLAQAKAMSSDGGRFNERYRAALDAVAAGRWSAARENVDAALTLLPRSPDLLRLRNDVDRAVAATPFWARGSNWLAACALVALVWVLLLGRALRRRREAVADPLRATTVEVPLTPSPSHRAEFAADPRLIGCFTMLNGSRAGEKLGLGGSGIRIGREAAMCEIVLENPKVSRLHAEVVSIDGRTLLIDRNSSNGTWVNDQKIDRRYLCDGDIIHFGGRNAVAVAYHAREGERGRQAV